DTCGRIRAGTTESMETLSAGTITDVDANTAAKPRNIGTNHGDSAATTAPPEKTRKAAPAACTSFAGSLWNNRSPRRPNHTSTPTAGSHAAARNADLPPGPMFQRSSRKKNRNENIGSII